MPHHTNLRDSVQRGAGPIGGSIEIGRQEASLVTLIAIGAVLHFRPPNPLTLALILCAVLIAMVSPVAASAATATALPFVFHPIHVGGSQFSLLEISLIVATLGVGAELARAAIAGFFGQLTRMLLGNWPTSLLAMLLAALGVASLLTVADPRHLDESLRELRLVVVEPIAALVLARYSIHRDGGRLLIAAMVGAGIAVALGSIVALMFGHGEVIGNGVLRATGPYPHPNNLALYLERVGLTVATLAIVNRRLRRPALAATIVIGLGLAVTLSRGALLAVFAGGSLIIMVARPRHAWRWLGLATIVALIGFGLLAGDRLWSTGTGGATSSRELIWRSSVRMIRDNPLFGVGLDQFLYQYAPHYVLPEGWPERYTSHPHNLIIDVWLRLGLLGLALSAMLVVITFREIRRLHRDGRSERWGLAVAGAAMLAGGWAHGMVDNGFFLPDLAVMTWIAIALIEPAWRSDAVSSP